MEQTTVENRLSLKWGTLKSWHFDGEQGQKLMKEYNEIGSPLFWVYAVIRRFYFFLVKWLVLKPLIKLSYIINGKMMGNVKWYQRHFTTPVKWKWLNSVTYKLTKYVMFS